MFTSQKFSQKLKENGCELESKKWYIDGVLLTKISPEHQLFNREIIRSYDIIYDVCIKYAVEFFWDNLQGDLDREDVNCTEWVLSMLQENEPQDKIEKYIWDNCKFNPLNK